jgi:nucleoid-associated protein YgaU
MGLLSFVKDAGEKLWDNITNKNEDQSDKLKSYLDKAGLSGTDKVNVSVENDVVKVTGEALNQEMKEKMMLVLGNVAGISKVEDNISVNSAEPEAHFYTVKKGDTLSAIAKSEYGNANDYMKIFEANKPMLTHPDKIYPGQVLRIPQK